MNTQQEVRAAVCNPCDSGARRPHCRRSRFVTLISSCLRPTIDHDALYCVWSWCRSKRRTATTNGRSSAAGHGARTQVGRLCVMTSGSVHMCGLWVHRHPCERSMSFNFTDTVMIVVVAIVAPLQSYFPVKRVASRCLPSRMERRSRSCLPRTRARKSCKLASTFRFGCGVFENCKVWARGWLTCFSFSSSNCDSSNSPMATVHVAAHAQPAPCSNFRISLVRARPPFWQPMHCTMHNQSFRI